MKSLFGLLFGIIICVLLATFAGESALNFIKIIGLSAFGSKYDLGLTLFYTTAFIFTGLSVCWSFHAGLFNIGAEGQLTIACIAAAYIGTTMTGIGGVAPIVLILIIPLLLSGLWGGIAGWLKVKKGSHEVIITMMLNFIAAAIANWITLEKIKNPDSQNPESRPITEAFYFSNDFVQNYFADSPANFSIVIAIILCLLMYYILNYTTYGFKLKATGKNAKTAQWSGILTQRIQLQALSLSGLLAGFVAWNEIVGSVHKFRLGFSADYGFVGIAVALLSRNNPILILPSAFLFGVLQKGASDLDIETEFITRDFARIMEAVIILSVVGFSLIKFKKKKSQTKMDETKNDV